MLARLLLRLTLRGDFHEQVRGDLDEEYRDTVVPKRGREEADRWYWRMALRSIAARWMDVGGRPLGRPRGATTGGGGVMGGWTRELRLTIRTLARRPAFTLLAVGTAGFGVGGATAVFSLANWMVIRPVPGVERMEGLFESRLAARDGGFGRTGLSLPIIRAMRAAAPGVTSLAGYQMVSADLQRDGADTERVGGHAITEGYFEALQVTPELGRVFSAQEYVDPALSTRVVLSESLWRDRFGADPRVVGRTLRLNGSALEVIGVAERGFRGPNRIGDADFWVTAHAYPPLQHLGPGYAADSLDARIFFKLIGRNPPDAELGPLDTALSSVVARFAAQHGDVLAVLERYRVQSRRGVGLDEYLAERSRGLFTALGAAAALLMLIACGNVANLLLVRAQRRRAEVAVRRALGASRARLYREVITEAVVLGLAGGAVGLLLLALVLEVTGGVRVSPAAPAFAPAVDGRVALFAFACAVVASVLFGALPALMGSAQGLAQAVKAGGRSVTPGARRLRAALTGAQVALSLSLLVGAGVLLRSLDALRSVPLGFEPEGVTYHYVDPTSQGWSRAEVHALAEDLRARLADDARIEAAAVTTQRPFWSSAANQVRAPGGDAEPTTSQIVWAGGGYPDVMHMPLVRGRWFNEAEESIPLGSPPPAVVVNRTLAQALFGTVEVVGRSLEFAGRGGFVARQIVGVVEDARFADLRGAIEPTTFEPRAASWSPPFTLLLRSRRPAAEVEVAVRDALRGAAPELPLLDSAPLSETVDAHLAEDRFLGSLIAAIGLLALSLATVGVYGTVSQLVGERSREIGLRVALGAARHTIVRMVVRDTTGIVVGGACLGVVVAAWLAGALEDRLFGVGPGDVVAYALSVTIIAGAGVLAAWAPARAAASVDPVEALRAE